MPKLIYELLNGNVACPRYAHDSDACFDLCLPLHTSELDAPVTEQHDDYQLYVPAGAMRTIDLAVAFHIPEGYHIKLYVRSSVGKQGISLANGTGIIDQDYRLGVKVMLQNNSPNTVGFLAGMRVVQGELCKNQQATLEPGKVAQDTVRTGGIGSTGV